jgi:hypothetical protein
MDEIERIARQKLQKPHGPNLKHPTDAVARHLRGDDTETIAEDLMI